MLLLNYPNPSLTGGMHDGDPKGVSLHNEGIVLVAGGGLARIHDSGEVTGRVDLRQLDYRHSLDIVRLEPRHGLQVPYSGGVEKRLKCLHHFPADGERASLALHPSLDRLISGEILNG